MSYGKLSQTLMSEHVADGNGAARASRGDYVNGGMICRIGNISLMRKWDAGEAGKKSYQG